MEKLLDNKYAINLKSLLRFELSSFLGRMLYNKKTPYKGSVNLLHLGCGDTYFEEFINADFYYLRWLPWRKEKFDWLLDLRYPLNCTDNYWDGVFTEHTIEHLTFSQNLALFKELNRTMKKNSWIRICVPGLEECLDAYSENPSEDGKLLKADNPLASKAEAIYHLTQNYGHQSVWDSDLLGQFLEKANFRNCQKVSFLNGNDKSLLKDKPERKLGSLYFEAQK